MLTSGHSDQVDIDPHSNKRGFLIVNTGSPDSPDKASVRRYLSEFLSDPYVMDTPWLLRMLILHLVILPRRPARSAKLYSKIWTPQGSPLIEISRSFTEKLKLHFNAISDSEIPVVRMAMRYGSPSIKNAMDKMAGEGISRITIFPAFPQFADATITSILTEVKRIARRYQNIKIDYIPSFFDNDLYIKSLSSLINTELSELKEKKGFVPDKILYTFHGLPERQLKKIDVDGKCLTSGCCKDSARASRGCYRAQCFRTAEQLARNIELKLDPIVSFQSRMGRIPWIGPHTEDILKELPASGIRRVAVVAPSFIADCLETLEEIAMGGREIFMSAGGEEYEYIPALNTSELWIQSVSKLLTEGPVHQLS